MRSLRQANLLLAFIIELGMLAALPWPCEPREAPVKRLNCRGPKRLPAFRGPATRPVRVRG